MLNWEKKNEKAETLPAIVDPFSKLQFQNHPRRYFKSFGNVHQLRKSYPIGDQFHPSPKHIKVLNRGTAEYELNSEVPSFTESL